MLHTAPDWLVRLHHLHQILGVAQSDALEQHVRDLRVLGCVPKAVPLLHPCVMARRKMGACLLLARL